MNGYLARLTTWVASTRFYTLETADNDIAVFVSIRHEDGASWTGTATYATANPDSADRESAANLAAVRARNLFKVRR